MFLFSKHLPCKSLQKIFDCWGSRETQTIILFRCVQWPMSVCRVKNQTVFIRALSCGVWKFRVCFQIFFCQNETICIIFLKSTSFSSWRQVLIWDGRMVHQLFHCQEDGWLLTFNTRDAQSLVSRLARLSAALPLIPSRWDDIRTLSSGNA